MSLDDNRPKKGTRIYKQVFLSKDVMSDLHSFRPMSCFSIASGHTAGGFCRNKLRVFLKYTNFSRNFAAHLAYLHMYRNK